MLPVEDMKSPIVDRFITPTTPYQAAPRSEEAVGEDSYLTQETAERSATPRQNSTELDSLANKMRAEVAADREQIAEARKERELANKDELAGMASRMMTGVMGNGKDYAVSDKDLFWRVATEYFVRKGDFDLEAVTRLYLSARAQGIPASNLGPAIFSELVAVVNKQWEKEPDFKKFVKKRCTRVPAHEIKTRFGNWFNNQDKESYKNITNDSLGDALEDYQTEARQTDAEIWNKIKFQTQDTTVVEEPTSSVRDETLRLSTASDAIELAAETLAQNALFNELTPNFVESLELGPIDSVVQAILEKYFRAENLSDLELDILLRQYTNKTSSPELITLLSFPLALKGRSSRDLSKS